MVIKTRRLLTAWASYLFYGDSSGYPDEEIKEIDNYLKKEGLPAPSDIQDIGFETHNDANSLGGDVSVYTFLIEGEENEQNI